MTQVKTKRKRLDVHNSYKSCGNCGLWLYVDDDYILIQSRNGMLDSPFYHRTYEGCMEATDQYNKIARLKVWKTNG